MANTCDFCGDTLKLLLTSTYCSRCNDGADLGTTEDQVVRLWSSSPPIDDRAPSLGMKHWFLYHERELVKLALRKSNFWWFDLKIEDVIDLDKIPKVLAGTKILEWGKGS